MTRASAAWLAAILVVATGLRVVHLDRASVWEDEVVTITLARQPTVPAMLASLRKVDATGAPLHPLLLRAWNTILGDSVALDRGLSAVCGVAAVSLVYALGRRAYGVTTGRLAGWLQALSPLDVNHSREARMYEVLVLLTCLSWWLLLSSRWSWGLGRSVVLGVVLAALAYTHPLGLLMVAALMVGYFAIRRESKLGVAAWVAVQLGMAAAVVPWAPRYLDHAPESLVAPSGWKSLGEWPESFTGGRTEAVLVGGVLLVVGVRTGLVRDRKSTRAFLAWLLVPVALLAAYSWFAYPIFAPRRYRIFVGPPYLILLAHGGVALPRTPRRLLIALLTIVAGGATLRVLEPNRPDWPGVAAIVRRVDLQSPILIVDDRANQSACLAFYLGKTPRVIPARRSRDLWDSHPEAFWRAIGQARRDPLPSPPSVYHRDRAVTLERVRLEHWSAVTAAESIPPG